jgi:hypothetical protein
VPFVSISPDEPEHTDHTEADEAIAVDTFVRESRGQFSVDITVMFPDGGVTRTIDTYRTRRRAEIAATWIKRAAARDIKGPRTD